MPQLDAPPLPSAERLPWAPPELTAIDVDQTQSGSFTFGDETCNPTASRYDNTPPCPS